jgi:ubiquitin-protein ligase
MDYEDDYKYESDSVESDKEDHDEQDQDQDEPEIIEQPGGQVIKTMVILLGRILEKNINKSEDYYRVYKIITDKIQFYKNFNIDILIEICNENISNLKDSEYEHLVDFICSYNSIAKDPKDPKDQNQKSSYAKNYGSGKVAKINYKDHNYNNKYTQLCDFFQLFMKNYDELKHHDFYFEYLFGLLIEILSNDQSSDEIKDISMKILSFIKNQNSKIETEKIIIIPSYLDFYVGLESKNVSSVDSFQRYSLNEKIQHNNTKAIMKQINILKDPAALPLNDHSNIYVLFSDSDITKFKFMITGPVDTPYRYGCYVFEGQFTNFPNSPPKVIITTTDSGRVRFNPNLYSCGKVCLSLLGTWAGPSWDPEHSTLLQILLSIQTLIFVQEPWYNEPGRTTDEKSSEKYNEEILGHNIQVAIKGQKENPDPDFRDIILGHFEKYSEQINELMKNKTLMKNDKKESLITKISKKITGS